jgi:hypothetical protein
MRTGDQLDRFRGSTVTGYLAVMSMDDLLGDRSRSRR